MPMIRSVAGVYVQSWSPSFSILIPFSRGGSRYSVKALSSPSIQERDLIVRSPRRPWMVMAETMILLPGTAFSSTFRRTASGVRSACSAPAAGTENGADKTIRMIPATAGGIFRGWARFMFQAP
ncbi:MAG: hypothetical protein BWX98_02455 [Candidatus Aminicenantes bacterium ADurb.Bin147]|nr:MAG: hypothetical protein BWX98_02455 [Candidatus Aminicenantes bacterium ADurb.Bin147]